MSTLFSKPPSSMNDSIKSTPTVQSPSKEALRSFNGSYSKQERTDYFNDTYNNPNLSAFNNSAEKQLNYSRASSSFRQVSLPSL